MSIGTRFIAINSALGKESEDICDGFPKGNIHQIIRTLSDALTEAGIILQIYPQERCIFDEKLLQTFMPCWMRFFHYGIGNVLSI